MGIRWEDYKNRRFLNLTGWAAYYKIKTYSDMRSHLLSAGVIPPHESHKDVLSILGAPEPPAVQEAPKERKAAVPAKEKPAPKRKPRTRRSTRKKVPSKNSKK